MREPSARKSAATCDLHSVPPVTGMLTLGTRLLGRARGRPDRPLAGRGCAPSRVHPGRAGARVGARSTLCPGSSIGRDAEVAPGSAVFGEVPDGELWPGAPASPSGSAPGPWAARPPYRPQWILAYAGAATADLCLPAHRCRRCGRARRHPGSRTPARCRRPRGALAWLLPSGPSSDWLPCAALVWVLVRCSDLACARDGTRCAAGTAWQAWATVRADGRGAHAGSSRSTRAR